MWAGLGASLFAVFGSWGGFVRTANGLDTVGGLLLGLWAGHWVGMFGVLYCLLMLYVAQEGDL